MSTPISIYFSFARMLNEQEQNVSPAELHGLLLGRSCAGASSKQQACLQDASVLFDGDIPARIQEAISGLHEMQQAELNNQELVAITLLLPQDDSPLPDRLLAMTQWCQGFLAGFGSHAASLNLGEKSKEILADLVAISQMQVDLQDSGDNQDEVNYMQLTEYLRVTPVLLYAMHSQQDNQAPKSPKNTSTVH